VADVVRRTARAIRRQPALEPGDAGRSARRRTGVVATAPAGSPPTVSVYIGGAATATPGLRYLASYAPVVDDVVEILEQGRTRIVLGKLA
jgi:hypothetical protein